MSGAKKVFLLGPGFIGSEILGLLLQEKYDVTTLVRSNSSAAKMGKIGVHAVQGTLEDKDLIETHTLASDVVIHTATADDIPSVEAIIKGIDRRLNDGRKTIYIHTSGASLLSDFSEGSVKNEFVFDDEYPEAIDALKDDAPHRMSDLLIVRGNKRFGTAAKLAIMIPPVIYGVGTLEERLSIQLPTLTRFALKHGYAGYVGAGLPVWAEVHVKDLATGYMTLLHFLEADPDTALDNPYFFCESGTEHSWKQFAEAIGQALHKAGKISDPVPRTVPNELYGDLFGAYTPVVVGANSRNKANRLRKLGWEAKEKDSTASLNEDELPIILKESKKFSGYLAPVASGPTRK
ncbi:hypothetical protein PVAG01_09955 [Phlyctema vagabunda]|uniref:NAD-dependent epimerase/dehydratase domain-containing protein n=1 Tax=Phlyctema vagabunda TaxID=108571 RepID=A0ABR4P4K6_9HELO